MSSFITLLSNPTCFSHNRIHRTDKLGERGVQVLPIANDHLVRVYASLQRGHVVHKLLATGDLLKIKHRTSPTLLASKEYQSTDEVKFNEDMYIYIQT
jgi:hypothetical protein